MKKNLLFIVCIVGLFKLVIGQQLNTLPRARSFVCGTKTLNAYQDAKAFGANVIRLFFVESDFINPNFGNLTDTSVYKIELEIQKAQAAGLKVVLVPGFSMYDSITDIQSSAFWNYSTLADDYANMWKVIAKRLLPYANTIYGYDIWNEPYNKDLTPYVVPTQWRYMSEKVIKAIREVDPNVWIIYETGVGGQSNGFWGLTPFKDNHIIYSLHMYDPLPFTHQGVFTMNFPAGATYPGNYTGFFVNDYWDKDFLRKFFKDVRKFQLTYDVPIYVGEFSVSSFANDTDAVRYFEDVLSLFEEYKWSWCYHAWRDWPGWDIENNAYRSNKIQNYMNLNTSQISDTYNTIFNTNYQYEAEYNTLQNNTLDTTCYEFSGSGVTKLVGQGSFIEWNNVNLGNSDTYKLYITYQNGKGVNQPCILRLNGVDIARLRFKPLNNSKQFSFEKIEIPIQWGNNTIRLTADSSTGGPTIDNIILKELPQNIYLEHDFGKDSTSNGWGPFNVATKVNPPWLDFKPTQANAVLYKSGVTLPPGDYTLSYDVKGALVFYITDGFGFNSKIYYYQYMNERNTARTITDKLVIDDNANKILIFNYSLSDTLGVSHLVIYKNNVPVANTPENNFNAESLIIYPNPAKDEFKINMKAIEGKQNLTLENTLGQVIFSEEISQANYIKSFSTKNLASGIYLVRVKGLKKSYVKKLLITK